MKPVFQLTFFAFMTALSFISLWVTFQVFVPKITEISRALEAIPHLFTLVVIGCGITYIFKSILD